MNVEQVTSFNYLGVQITSSKDLITEVRHQAIKAPRISGCLNGTIWSNKYLQNEAKVPIYKSTVSHAHCGGSVKLGVSLTGRDAL